MSNPSRLVLCLSCVYVIWGTTFFALTVALESVPPFLLGAVRFTSAGLILLVVGGCRMWPPLREWKRAALLGTFYIVGSAGAAAWCARSLPTGSATLISGLTPCWIVLLDALANRKRLPLRVGLGIAFGAMACLLLVDPASGAQSGAGLSVTLILASGGLAWAVGSTFAGRMRSELSPLASTGLFSLFGGAALGGVGLARGEWDELRLDSVTIESVGATVYLVVFGSVVVLSAYEWLVRNTSAPIVASHAYVNPVVALSLGVVIAGEVLTPAVLMSAVASLVAVSLLTVRQDQVATLSRQLGARLTPPALEMKRSITGASPTLPNEPQPKSLS